MQKTILSNDVLSSQGSLGSKPLAVPNPAPGVGPTAGDASLSTEINPGPLNANPPALAPKAGNGALSTEYGNFADTVKGE